MNHRLKKQDARTHKEVKEGEMSKAKAAKLYRKDHAIRQEERHMVRQNGGHITKQKQRNLNQQENPLSHRIGQ